MEEKLNELKLYIQNESYKDELKTVRSFGGAGLIITHEGDTRPADIVVYTKHEKELSWLTYKLADIFDGQVDYLNKYEFYLSIGRLANEFIKEHGDDNIIEMMEYIITNIN